MQLSDETIEEYIQIYEEDFGETLTLAEARIIVTRLMALYEVICTLLPEERANIPEP